jgi:hypothetical protein
MPFKRACPHYNLYNVLTALGVSLPLTLGLYLVSFFNFSPCPFLPPVGVTFSASVPLSVFLFLCFQVHFLIPRLGAIKEEFVRLVPCLHALVSYIQGVGGPSHSFKLMHVAPGFRFVLSKGPDKRHIRLYSFGL